MHEAGSGFPSTALTSRFCPTVMATGRARSTDERQQGVGPAGCPQVAGMQDGHRARQSSVQLRHKVLGMGFQVSQAPEGVEPHEVLEVHGHADRRWRWRWRWRWQLRQLRRQRQGGRSQAEHDAVAQAPWGYAPAFSTTGVDSALLPAPRCVNTAWGRAPWFPAWLGWG